MRPCRPRPKIKRHPSPPVGARAFTGRKQRRWCKRLRSRRLPPNLSSPPRLRRSVLMNRPPHRRRRWKPTRDRAATRLVATVRTANRVRRPASRNRRASRNRAANRNREGSTNRVAGRLTRAAATTRISSGRASGTKGNGANIGWAGRREGRNFHRNRRRRILRRSSGTCPHRLLLPTWRRWTRGRRRSHPGEAKPSTWKVSMRSASLS